MTVATIPTVNTEAARRRLLAASDRLLDRVESLRMADQVQTPPALEEAIAALQRRLGPSSRTARAASLEAAHDLVFAVQERLLALSRGTRVPRQHSGRAAGEAAVVNIGSGERWKVLVLPPMPEEARHHASWRERAQAMLERALDRWEYAHHHAARAIRDDIDVEPAAGRLRAAWQNYWDLLQEAEHLGVVTGHADITPPPTTASARPRSAGRKSA